MNHKRHKTKSTRGLCYLCKPHKHENAPMHDRQRPNVTRRMVELNRERR